MKRILILSIVAMMSFVNVIAQRTTDIDGGKDYPLVSRFDGSVMEFYREVKWDTYKLPVFPDNPKEFNYESPRELEGKIIRTQYSVSPENNVAYVLKNYEAAFKANGFKILLEKKPGEIEQGPSGFDGDFYGDWHHLNLGRFQYAYSPTSNGDMGIIIAKTTNKGKDIYVVEVVAGFSNTTLITQDVIEVEAAETGMVTAKSIGEGIAENGHMAFYDIHFDTGKADLKPESEQSLKTIAEFLNAHPDKKFIIVGHTDNTGDFDANVTLSQQRAEAVMHELISKYSVKADQLKAFGDGQTAPVASNATEEGKTKNRRVEIVAW